MRKLRDARAKQSTIASPEEVLEVLTTQIRVLPNVLAGEDGNLILVSELTNEQAQAIAGLKHTERTVASGEDVVTQRRIEYKLVDRQKAAETLARHHGLFLKHNESSTIAIAYGGGTFGWKGWWFTVNVKTVAFPLTG